MQRIRAKGGLTWNVMKGLTAKSELSLSRHWQETKEWDGGLEAGYNTAELTNKNGYAIRWATTLNYEVVITSYSIHYTKLYEVVA